MAQLVLIVDDGGELAQLLREALEQGGYRVLVAQDGESAMHTLRHEHPDLVLMDLVLPARGSWDGTRTVRGEMSLVAMPLIGLNARQNGDKLSEWNLGTGDPVTEPLNPREIAARVRSALHRAQGEPAPRRVVQVGNIVFDLDRRQVQVGDQPVHLTLTELGLLQALAERPGHTLSRLEMIERGLGYNYEGVDRTVDSHIKNLRRKLARAGATEGIVETVFGVGYRLAVGRRPDIGADP